MYGSSRTTIKDDNSDDRKIKVLHRQDVYKSI